ncbi:MAG: hypothetical protein IPN24_18040 [Betaproteobacteria bacterium]|nr:hypothetical protein [Betaproteobacteria bacterium]
MLSTAITSLATQQFRPAAQTWRRSPRLRRRQQHHSHRPAGGAGLAHVGVLKVREELRVPIHCVTGTSMGAIVGGGTFAAGTSPAEMEKIVLAADWAEIFPGIASPREVIAPFNADRRLQDAVRARVRCQGR